MIGTIGNSVIINSEPDFCIKNVGLVKPKSINSNFLIQYFHSTLFQNYLLGKQDDYSDESEHLIPAKVDSCFDDDFLG